MNLISFVGLSNRCSNKEKEELEQMNKEQAKKASNDKHYYIRYHNFKPTMDIECSRTCVQ